MTVVAKRFAQSEKFQQFVKAEALLFQPIRGFYGDFTQGLKETCEYTQSVEQMDDRSKQNRTEFS